MTSYDPAEVERLVREMPTINSRRPYDDENLPGYDESFNDWAGNNQDAVEWLLENGRAMADQLEAARARITALESELATLRAAVVAALSSAGPAEDERTA